MVKMGVSFYYVGDLERATVLYEQLFRTNPAFRDEDWVRFHLEGGDIALHRNPDLPLVGGAEPVRFGAYGLQAQLRDPWGNRLSVLQPEAG